jgi:hypothetical protein
VFDHPGKAPAGNEKKIDKTITVKQENGEDSASITLVSVSTVTEGGITGAKPESGTFVVLGMRIVGKTGTFSTNSLYAQLKTAGGKIIEGTDGNATFGIVEPDLPLAEWPL